MLSGDEDVCDRFSRPKAFHMLKDWCPSLKVDVKLHRYVREAI
jgi:hypothetical protein